MSEHILSLSYGKDSLACLGAIEDHYMEEELRKRGVDLRAWLDGVTFDQEGNEVTFNETKSG